MKFDAIRLRHVRRFGAEGLRIEDLSTGLNVLSRPNEYGKSTILDALRAGLFAKATSSAKDVKSLIPVAAEGDPLVELDFTGPKGSFRLRKCFAGAKKRSQTRLFDLPAQAERAREAEAEALIAELVGSDAPTSGLPGLLWLGQGTALSDVPTADNARTMAGLLSDEVTEVSGGEEAGRVIERAEKALAELETRGRGQPTGELKDAIENVEAEAASLAEHETKLRRHRDLRDELTAKRAELRRLEDQGERARRQDELKAAEEDARKAILETERLGHTRQRLDAQQDRLRDAQARLSDFDTKLRELKSLKDQRSMAKVSITEGEEALGMAEAEFHRLQEMREQATKTAKAANAKLGAFDKAERAALQSEKRGVLERALEDADKIAAEIGNLREQMRGPAMDLGKLRSAEAAFLKAEASARASAPSVELVRGTDATLDGAELPPGEKLPIVGEGRIEAGETILRIHVPERRAIETTLRTAREHLDRLLAETDCASVEEAVRKDGARQEAKRTAASLTRELDRLAPDGIDAIRTALAALPSGDAIEKPEGDRRELEARKNAADQALDEAEQQLASSLKRLDILDRRLVEQRAELRTTEALAQSLRAVVGTDDKQAARRAELERAVEEAEKQRQQILAALDALEQRAMAAEQVQARLNRLRSAVAGREKAVGRLREDMSRLRGELSGVYLEGVEEARDAAKERLAEATEKRDRLEGRRRALRLLLETLRSEQEERREKVMGPVMRYLTPMLQQVIGDAELRFASDWTVEALTRPGRPEALSAQSDGTREQVALLTRLAFARLQAREGEAVPLILDDAMVYADDARAGRLFDLLHQVAEETQIIVFTCRGRLFDDLGGHRIEPKEWPEV